MFQKRIIAMFLCVLMVFTAVSCAIPDVDSDTTEGGETTSNLTTLNLTDKFVVVRSEKADSDTIAAGMLLIKAVKDIFGFYLEYKDDWARTEADIKPHEYEIVVGKTNREASRQFNDTMTILDYTYLIASEKQIVIYGKCGESALSATRKFLSDFFGYDEELGTGEKSTLEINKSYVFKNTYEYDVLEFNNIKANEYTVVTENLNKTQALILADTVEKMCGVGIPVVNFKDFGGGNAIYVGIGDEGKNLYYYGEYEYLFTAKHALGKSSIIIDATNKQLAVAVNEFIENYLPQNKNDSVNIQVAVDKEVFGYTCLSDLNGVTFVSETKETLASGIVYSTKIYKDKDGKPVIGSVLTIEPNSAKLLTGTPNDGTQITGVHATVLNQMKSAVANNKNVIAGINADFFDLGGTYSPTGLCVKDGVFLHEAGSAPWFAMLKDGSFIIDSGSNYQKRSSEIYTAVGGRNILLLKGAVNDINYQKDFGSTRHPRTAIGIREDGGIVMIVVDGRQPLISNGASLADLAVMLKELGCVSALNLDGGGSSTFITKIGSTYKTRNSPSGNALRSVYNSLLVIPKV